MDNVAVLPDDQRAELFRETATRRRMANAVAEKDFWVCWSLAKLFDDPTVSPKILFKGGTSLSKVFGLIERFSEDIDLILDWREITDQNPQIQRTRTKQDRIFANCQMRAECATYLRYPTLFHSKLYCDMRPLAASKC
jgi:predicted nucleotidyltransferase component of viral defense system